MVTHILFCSYLECRVVLVKWKLEIVYIYNSTTIIHIYTYTSIVHVAYARTLRSHTHNDTFHMLTYSDARDAIDHDLCGSICSLRLKKSISVI